jgi:putative transposase
VLVRKCYRYRLYPTKEQAVQLQWVLDRCRELYNAALQERRDAYEMACAKITRYTQSGELPGIKEDCLEFKQVGSQVLQEVLKRVDLAFQAFFRRVRAGDKPSYPRFKSDNRYDSFTYSRAGWELSEDDGRLLLAGIGALKVR